MIHADLHVAGTTDAYRQHARLRTRAIARLDLPDGRALLCEIYDFSQNGLQLIGLDSEIAASVDATGAPGVRVEFPLDETGIGAFRLTGVLAHASSDGFGVKLANMGKDAYQALIQARSDIDRAGGIPPSGLLPEENQAILRDCIHFFHRFLDRVWHDFLASIASKVAERDTATLSLTEHSRYLGALSALLSLGEDASRQHYASLVKQMHRMGEARDDSDRPPPGDAELSLVDDDSFDDWLSLANIYNRIEVDNRSAIFQFDQRFSRLTPVPIDRHNDPFAPESVCLAFQDTLRRYDFNTEMRMIVYRLFGDALSPHYPTLYEQLNLLLAPLKPARQEPTRREDIRATGSATTDTPASHAETHLDDVSAQIGKLAEIAEKLFALAPGSRAEVVPEASTTMTSVAPDSVATSDALRETLALLAHRPPPIEPPPAQSSAVPSLDELLATAPAARTLTEQVAVLLGRNQAASLAPPQRQALGLASNLMNLALAEHADAAELDVLLKKLEKPLYELVLRGEDPLHRPDHPLRRLINLIDRFAIVADDDGKLTDRELANLLGTVIDHAVEQATDDPGSYGKACEALEKLLKFPIQFHRQRIGAQQEMCAAQHLIRTAKRTAAKRLDTCLAGRAVPRILLNLIDRGLRQYLVLHTMQGAADTCEAIYRLLDALSCDTPVIAAETCRREIERGLRAVNTDSTATNTSLAELSTFLAAPSTAERVKLPAGWFHRELGPDAEEPARAPDADLPARLGEWWEFDQEGRVVPMQLVWLGGPSGPYGFVNRAATRNVQPSAAELIRRQTEGTFRRGEDRNLPLLERSENGTVDNLYRQLAHRAHHDPATDLLNRKGFMYLADRLPNRFGRGHALGMIEFIPFRAILDTYGVEVGERLTRELADLATRHAGPNAKLALIGDGRFAVLLPDLDLTAARRQAEGLAAALRGHPFQHNQTSFALDAHIGLAGLMPGLTDPAEALRRAATACAAATQAGQPVQTYEDAGEQTLELESLRTWGQRIDELLAGSGLFLRCQAVSPLHPIADEAPYYEILLGLRDNAGQIVSPQPFVEAVEYWKRSRDLDLWVIDRTFAWIRANSTTFASTGGFSINLSGLSMSDSEILSAIEKQFANGDVDPERIVFEVTETAAVGNYEAAQTFIERLRRHGCRFCIDDFGSGNASYGYLRNLRTDTLKIDGAFVRDMADDPDLQAMVKSMNDIGHSLGMKTVAEFVASPEILALVRDIGVDYGQGYAIAKPIPLDELATPRGLDAPMPTGA